MLYDESTNPPQPHSKDEKHRRTEIHIHPFSHSPEHHINMKLKHLSYDVNYLRAFPDTDLYVLAHVARLREHVYVCYKYTVLRKTDEQTGF